MSYRCKNGICVCLVVPMFSSEFLCHVLFFFVMPENDKEFLVKNLVKYILYLISFKVKVIILFVFYYVSIISNRTICVMYSVQNY